MFWILALRESLSVSSSLIRAHCFFSWKFSSSRFKLRSIQVTEEESKADRKELIHYSLPLLFSSTLTFFQRWADTFMLGAMSSVTAVAIFTVSMRMAYFIQIPLTSFNLIFSPLIAEIYAKKDFQRLSSNFKTVTKLVFTLSVPIFGIIVLLPEELLSVFGKEFENGAIAMSIICFGQLINVSIGSTGQMLVMTGRPRIHMINSGVFIIITIVLNWFLIPEYGIIGAGIANAVSLATLNIVRIFQLYKFIGMHPFSKEYVKPIFAGVIGLLVTYFFKANMLQDHQIWSTIAITMGIFLFLYTGLTYFMKLSAAEVEIVRMILRKIRK